MSRVITFSQVFPAYHPKKGEKTYFVEKIWKGLYDAEPSNYIPFHGYWQRYEETFPWQYLNSNIHQHAPKWHTIRSGHRWKVGDTFSPRVWSGKPYCSKQITIAPDIEIVKIWDFEIDNDIRVNGKHMFAHDVQKLANNDGLTSEELMQWFKFPAPFSGQVICWNLNLEYL